MNRIEFMTELAALLQSLPEEERNDAMQYYNDYFDDAGEDKEQEVIAELESPKKVADKIKGDILENQEEDSSSKQCPGQYKAAEYEYTDEKEKKPWSSNALKIILIIAIILVGGPVIIPCTIGILAVIVGGVAAMFAIFIALVILFIALAIVGVALVIAGIAALIPEIAVGLALLGAGLIIGVIGAIGTVASVRLCIIVFPGIIRGIVWVCRKPFHREAVS